MKQETKPQLKQTSKILSKILSSVFSDKVTILIISVFTFSLRDSKLHFLYIIS